MGHGHSHAPATAGGAHRRRLVVVLVPDPGRPGGRGRRRGACPARWPCSPTPGTWPPTPPGIALALAAVTLAQRPARGRRTFGWQRVEILAAVANGFLLLAVAGYVLVEAIRRIGDPPEIGSGLMLVVASVGLVVNLGSLAVLHRGRDASLNIRGAYLEVLADALGSVAVIVAAVVIATTGLDAGRHRRLGGHRLPGACRAPGTCSARRFDVLLEAAPRGVDLADVRAHILGVDGVLDVHDLHAWTITSGLPVLSAHVVVTDEALAAGHGGRVLDALCACLGEHFDLEHCTFQLEAAAHAGHESPVHD